jgi:hypothetical protein
MAPWTLKLVPLLPAGFVAFGIGMSGKHLCYAVERFFDKLDIFGKTK